MAGIFFGFISFILSYYALKASAYYDPAPYQSIHCPTITPNDFKSIKEMQKVPALEGGKDWSFDPQTANKIRNPKTIIRHHEFAKEKPDHVICDYLIIDQNGSRFFLSIER